MEIVDEGHDYVVSIPEMTPAAAHVQLHFSKRLGAHILHAESPDQSELYFEVAAFPDLMNHDQLAEGERTFLRNHSVYGQLTDVKVVDIMGHQGTTYDFRGTLQGRWKERRFLILEGPHRTYRLVYDPTSGLNERLLQSLQLR